MTGLTFFSGDVVLWSHSSLGLELLTSNLFSEFSSFHVGNKDLKRRTGSWRVVRILTTAWGAILIGGAILIWLGLVDPRNYWLVVTIALPFVLIGVAYLYLYPLPRKKSSTQP